MRKKLKKYIEIIPICPQRAEKRLFLCNMYKTKNKISLKFEENFLKFFYSNY